MQNTQTIDDCLAELRGVLDEAEKIDEIKSRLAKRRAELESEIIAFSEKSGLTSFKTDKLSVTVTEDLRFKYDADKWDDLVRWAVDTGNLFIIQRRLTDSRIKSLIADGVALPAGLTQEGHTKVSSRRL